ncbi:copper homeostasis protein CutC [Niallia sp. 03133]|uniref:copper homeostasis protein CutC n=1 Tax=Niallia sp. 03133 TaxID=3458060 RepID=UPI004044BCA4
MIKEVCVENFTMVPEAIARGADRIELCDNLNAGGTTVSHGVAAKTIPYCKTQQIKVMSMIRPRGGNFIYSRDELEIMKHDIIHLKKLGTDGVVLGCLTDSGWIDEGSIHFLLEAAQGLDITFHMAFDEIDPQLQLEAIDWLVEIGVNRILTHGGLMDSPIEKNLMRIKEYLDYAAGRIIILPGGGITNKNVNEIAAKLPISEAHGTKIVGELRE